MVQFHWNIVKKLGYTLDCHLTMNEHVSNTARTCYFELSRLASIYRFLTSTSTATLVSAFVLSRIDYCNSLLFCSTHGVTSHLQRMQNYATMLLFLSFVFGLLTQFILIIILHHVILRYILFLFVKGLCALWRNST